MSRKTVTAEVMEAVLSSDMIIGAPRMAGEFSDTGIPYEPQYQPEAVGKIVDSSSGRTFTLLVSGDTGFYSGAKGLLQRFSSEDYDVEVLPGISSMSYFFAKAGIPWQDAVHISCHGRSCNVVEYVRRNKYTFLLTGNNIQNIGKTLCQAGFGNITVKYGENLGMEGQNIGQITARELMDMVVSPLTVLLLINPEPDASVPSGIPDSSFIRGKIPMTKAPVRSVIMSRLALKPGDNFIDIGAGTGSVTVEGALACWKGKVCAIERNPEGAALIRKNCSKFHIGNVEIIEGSAPEELEQFDHPEKKAIPDAAFIGGSAGKMEAIVERLLEINPNMRIVISAIVLESVASAMDALSSKALDPEVIQISAASSMKAGKLHMMKAENPIFIISGGGIDE